MSRRALRILFPAALAVSAGAALAAPAQQIASDSTLHRVEATYVGKPAVSVLRHTRVRSDGSSQVALVPGTDDVFSDREPTLAIDPVQGTPVLAWTRDTGGGPDIYVARYDGLAWSPPVRVLQDPEGVVRPQIQVSDGLVHVVAQVASGYVRISLERETLEPAFGPETLPTSLLPITPGVDPVSVHPPRTLVYFASDVLRPAPTDPGIVVVWGVRDEPVPIDYVQALLLPEASTDALTAVAAPIEGSLTVTAASPIRVWYTLFRDTSWLEFSAVDLNETTTMPDVRSMLADMIRRGAN